MPVSPRLRFLSVFFTLSVLLGAGFSARADEVRVGVRSDGDFYSRTEFPSERGYFRTDEGRYYHYDKDRDGWHHGRNHHEGERLDRHHDRGHDRDHR